MTNVLKMALGIALGLTALPANAAAGAPEIKVLTELDRFEPFDGHLFHAGHLWVGRSRKDLGSFYRLEVFAPDGTQQASAQLTHSLRYIYPFGAEQVLVVGLGLDGLSHYTVAQVVGGQIQAKASTIPAQALADRFAGKPGQLVFSDPGGFDDPDHPTDPGTPLPTLFNITRGGPRYLGARIAGPRNGLTIGNALYLISSPSLASGGRTLNKVDVAAESFTKVLDKREGLSDLVYLPGVNLLALSESETGHVLLVDLKTDRLSATLTIEGGRPHAVAVLNDCLLVGTEDTKQILVYDMAAGVPAAPIARWDLSALGAKFYQLRDLAADPVSGNVFARSAYACSPVDAACGADGRNSVVLVAPAANDPTRVSCLKH